MCEASRTLPSGIEPLWPGRSGVRSDSPLVLLDSFVQGSNGLGDVPGNTCSDPAGRPEHQDRALAPPTEVEGLQQGCSLVPLPRECPGLPSLHTVSGLLDRKWSLWIRPLSQLRVRAGVQVGGEAVFPAAPFALPGAKGSRQCSGNCAQGSCRWAGARPTGAERTDRAAHLLPRGVPAAPEGSSGFPAWPRVPSSWSLSGAAHHTQLSYYTGTCYQYACIFYLAPGQGEFSILLHTPAPRPRPILDLSGSSLLK